MSLSCTNFQYNSDHCAVNWSASRQLCQASAFVLHQIPQFTTATYLNFVKEKFAQGKNYDLSYPKSVHFLIGDNGAIYKLVELHDRAWGVSSLVDPSWPALNQCSWSDWEDLFIHIGFIGQSISTQQIESAAQIICCTALDAAYSNIPINETGIIVARDLNTSLDNLWSVPGSIIARAQVCYQNNGRDPFFIDDIGTYGTRISALEAYDNVVEDRLTDLETCCCDNKERLTALEASVAALEESVADINVESLEQRLDDLEAGNLEMWKAIRVIQNCLECNNLCDDVTPVSIAYRLDLDSSVKLVPGSLQHINLPIKINDTEPVPIVTTGPLWYASLVEDEQTSCTTFKVKASARLSSAEWCAGRLLELFAVINSENILMNTYTAEGGNQSAFVYGETIFTVPPDSVVYIALRTDEDTSPLEVIMANIEIECLDGVLEPACVECDTV